MELTISFSKAGYLRDLGGDEMVKILDFPVISANIGLFTDLAFALQLTRENKYCVAPCQLSCHHWQGCTHQEMPAEVQIQEL